MVLQTIALGLVEGVSLYYDMNTCDRPSRCYKDLTFEIRLRDMIHSKNAIKIEENVFGFENNCVGTCYRNFSLL